MKTTLKIVATLGLLLGLWGVTSVFAQSETGRPFITKWHGTAGKALAIPIFGKEYKLVIKNERGEEVKREEKLIVENLMDPYTFTPDTDGIYTIEAGPEGVKFMRTRIDGSKLIGEPSRLLEVVQFGTVAWEQVTYMFSDCKNMTLAMESDAPNLSQVTSTEYMFYNCSIFNDPLHEWKVEHITDMNGMFASCSSFNQPLDSWNVSNVTSMNGMFSGCSSFNQPLDSWDVSNVTSMNWMFAGCSSFNQPLNDWTVNKVTNMNGLFAGCSSFNQPLDKWTVAQVTSMEEMFNACFAFNQSLEKWNVENVLYMKNMFSSCYSFNQPLNEWNVSNVTSMYGMFAGCSSFNQPLDKWTVNEVKSMSDMFKGCSSFNQPLGTWKIKKAIEGLYTTAMSPSNYSQTLVGWAAQADIAKDVEFNEEVRGLIYNNKGKEARDKLRSKGWVFKKDIHKVGGVSLTPHTLSLALNKEVILPLDKWGVEEAEEVTLSTDMEEVISKELTEDKKGVRIRGIKTGTCTLTATIAAKEGEGAHVAYTSTCVVNVYIPIEDITITPNSKTLKVGQKLTLKADIIPTNATDQEVHWYTSPKYIVEVDSNTGQVTARMAGKCTISVKKEDHGRWFIKTYPLIVVDEIAPVTRIALVQTSRTIKVGATTQLVGVVFPDNAEQGLVWSSSAPQIATVSDGLVLGKKVGSCTITAESRDPRYTQKHECKIIVEPSGNETFPVTLSPAEHGSIKIENKDENALAAVPQGTELTVTVTPAEGYKLKRLKANEEDITTTCKFIVMEATVVTAEFEKKTFSITQDIQGTGSLKFIDANNQALDPNAIPYETVVKVVPEVSGSWELISLMLNNEDISASKSFVLKDNVMLHAIFQDKSVPTFEVTVTQTAGGTIAIPKYPTALLKSVSKGTTLTVITTPDDGYELKSLKAGDVDITTTKQFIVTANTEVKAVFEKPTFSVTLTQPENGKLEIEGYATQTSITVAKDTKLTIKATPATGYKLKEIVVNGQKLSGTTFVVTIATTVTAVFEKETFAVTTSVNDAKGGEIAISGAADLKAVAYGTELTVTVTEKEGYKLKELKANDADITASRKFTVTKMTVVTAVFESKQDDNNNPGAVEDALLANISVVPNPFSAQLRILNPEGVAARYELVNASGIVVRSGALSGTEEIVDTETLPAGVYFVHLETQNGAQKSIMVSK